MLKDTLNSLLIQKSCVVGEAVMGMDTETRNAFEQIMCSPVGDYLIANALKSEGIAISREAIHARRECFNPESQMNCKCFPKTKKVTK